MGQAKLTAVRGRNNLKDITIVAGTAIAGSDAMELNIDYTKLSKGEALLIIRRLQEKIIASKWPLL